MSRSLDADRAGGGYALGHSDEEIERLSTQARLIDPITRRFFREAGLEHGMRVLDVGCGAGDTSALLLQMVGDKGEVVGVDRAPAAIAAAKRKIGDRADLQEQRVVASGRPRIIYGNRTKHSLKRSVEDERDLFRNADGTVLIDVDRTLEI